MQFTITNSQRGKCNPILLIKLTNNHLGYFCQLKNRFVKDLTSTRNKTNLQYIGGDKPHLTSQFCKNELNLNTLPNMISESSLTRFVRSIVPHTIGPF